MLCPQLVDESSDPYLTSAARLRTRLPSPAENDRLGLIHCSYGAVHTAPVLTRTSTQTERNGTEQKEIRF